MTRIDQFLLDGEVRRVLAGQQSTMDAITALQGHPWKLETAEAVRAYFAAKERLRGT